MLFNEWRQLRHLKSQLRSLNKANAAAVEKAKKSGSNASQIYDLRQELIFGEWEIEDEINVLLSRRLCRKAYRYRIPIPSHSDENLWEQSERTGAYYLTEKGYAELRAAIRKEQNEQWQSWLLRIQVAGPILTGLTGAIGALIGLISLWHR